MRCSPAALKMANGRYALIITSDVYDDARLTALATPSNDSRLLGNVLGSSRIGGFAVRRLTNPTSWRAAKAIEEFFTGRQYDDVLLLYFSGHGLKSDGGELYFATRNTSHRALRSTSIPAQFIRDIMRTSHCQRQMLVLDCCYGGAFARGLTKGDSGVDVTERLQGFGTVVLTASNSLEFAWQESDADSVLPASVFTRVLVEGMRDGSADLDGDGQITANELYDYAIQRIQLLGAQQTPTLSSVGQEGDLVVARAVRRALAASGPTIDLSAHVAVRDAGNEGSVLGHSLSVAMETSLGFQGRLVRLSARYAYCKARYLDDPDNWERDLGATIDSGRKIATQFGLPLDAVWPYVAGERNLPEGETWETMDTARPRYRARFHAISVYEEIPYHLMRGHPVLTGVQVFQDSWYADSASTTGWIRDSASRLVVGSHAIVIVGYDSVQDALKFANTWGMAWGDNGFGYLHRQVVERSLVHGSRTGGRTRSGSRGPVSYWAVEVPLDSRHYLEPSLSSKPASQASTSLPAST